ncbi:hypothetical protein B0H14DRAFT_2798531, partial [Mycena olivaceomarginata]
MRIWGRRCGQAAVLTLSSFASALVCLTRHWSRCARRRHHLVRAGATRTVLRESCTGAVGGARAHFSQITGTGGGVAAAASVRAAAERAPL